MEQERIKKFAQALLKSEETRVSVPPLVSEDSSLTIDHAYAIQLENVKAKVKAGQIVSGKKIGLTSEGIQKQLGVNEPDYGHLFASMDKKDGKVITSDFLQPKIEGELAFVLNKDLVGKNITVEQVLDATEYVVAAFEIVDSRVKDWEITLIDTVADNASSGCYVLGQKKLTLAEFDLLDVTMELYKNDELVGTGESKAVLGNPAAAVAWLANRLGDYGVSLKKGEVILSGAFSAAPKAEKGDVFRAEFSHFGTVEASFI